MYHPLLNSPLSILSILFLCGGNIDYTAHIWILGDFFSPLGVLEYEQV